MKFSSIKLHNGKAFPYVNVQQTPKPKKKKSFLLLSVVLFVER